MNSKIVSKVFTKRFLFSLPEGVYLASHCGYSPWQPRVELIVGPRTERDQQWRTIVASKANGRRCGVFKSKTDRRLWMEEMLGRKPTDAPSRMYLPDPPVVKGACVVQLGRSYSALTRAVAKSVGQFASRDLRALKRLRRQREINREVTAGLLSEDPRVKQLARRRFLGWMRSMMPRVSSVRAVK
jgi:hypothetical protein